MGDDADAVSFRVSTTDLTHLIEMLRQAGGLSQYPEAYQAFVLERSRRELCSPPDEIRLAPHTFEALPREVQQILMGGSR
jgi:hypothetical protein